MSVKYFWASVQSSQGSARTIRWPCEPIILSIGRFKGSNEVSWTIGESQFAEEICEQDPTLSMGSLDGESLFASDQPRFDNAGFV